MPDYTLVDHADAMIPKLDEPDRIGVDTEFMREKTFFAELCLVQVSIGDRFYCVDPLNGDDMGKFWDSLMRPTWVLHSGRQDIEVVYQTARQMPDRLFDTQIAAGLLGYAPQMGYATLVSEFFEVEIPKSHTRADWSKRPLSDAYLEYAAEDVEYLLPAWEVLAEKLDVQGRLAWAEEDSATLLNPALYDIARLAAWRENEALRANRPRQWIVKDSALLELAATLPSSSSELENIKDLAPGLIRRAGNGILAAVDAAKSDDNDYAPPRPPSETQKALLKAMQKQVADCADSLGLAAETVASKRDLSAIIFDGDRESKVLGGWRRELIGEDLLKLL
jgi:ribonuclease D